MEVDVGVVAQFIEAFNDLDVERALETLDPDAELMPLLAYLREPSAPLRGTDGLRTYFTDLATLDTPPVLLGAQITIDGDDAVVLATARTTGEDGIIDHPLVMSFKLRDGLITMWQSFGSIATARAHLRLS